MYFFIVGNASSTYNYSYFTNLMVINLTDHYGQGYEPTAEWLDQNIEYFEVFQYRDCLAQIRIHCRTRQSCRILSIDIRTHVRAILCRGVRPTSGHTGDRNPYREETYLQKVLLFLYRKSYILLTNSLKKYYYNRFESRGFECHDGLLSQQEI